MFLHDVGFDKFDIECEDTLINPQHWDDEPFELIVSNPPYSIKWQGDDNPLLINDPRFAPAGVLAPKSKADMAFIMHSLSWLAPNGVAAIVCYTGIMYRGGAEKKIRQYLVDNNFIDCVIQLPGNLFFGTSIPTCIMVLKKGKTDNKVLFIDATDECVKVTNNNKLNPDNINRILDAFTERKNEEYFSYLASHDEIVDMSYDLSVPMYVLGDDTKEVIDIDEINEKLKNVTTELESLRNSFDRFILTLDSEDGVLKKLLSEKAPHGVKTVPLWSVTVWDKKFNAVDRKKQDKIISYPYLLAKDLFALERDEGEVFLLSTGEQTGWTTEELAGSNMMEGEVVTIPWGKSRAVVDCIKYYKGKFVTADNRIMTSKDISVLSNKYLYYWVMSMGDVIDSYYRGAGIKHPDMRKVLDMEIPLPDIAIQNEIVNIMDEMEKSESRLKELLLEEIGLRNRQCQYYSDRVISAKI